MAVALAVSRRNGVMVIIQDGGFPGSALSCLQDAPGSAASREPGVHNHSQEVKYGFPWLASASPRSGTHALDAGIEMPWHAGRLFAVLKCGEKAWLCGVHM
jgi:hypothetical protein